MEITDYQKKEIEYFSSLFMYLGARRDNGATNNMESLGNFTSVSSEIGELEDEFKPNQKPLPEIHPVMRKGKLVYPKPDSLRLNLETGKYYNGPSNPKEYYDKHKEDYRPCKFCMKPVKVVCMSAHTRSVKCKRIAALINPTTIPPIVTPVVSTAIPPIESTVVTPIESESESESEEIKITPLLRKGKLWYPNEHCKRLNMETGKYNTSVKNPKEYYEKHKEATTQCEFCKK
jgi:hypothetical protein